MFRYATLVCAMVIFAATVTVRAAIPDKPQASVTVKKVQATELSDIFSYPARVSPKVNTVVLAESDGVVAEVRTPLGQAVRANERLLKIQHTDPVYQYAPIWATAPVGGIVSSVEVNEGSYVSRGQKLATVTDPTQVRVNVEVPASDLPMIKKGVVGEFRISGKDGPAVLVVVNGVSPFVDPATGTASCELEIAPVRKKEVSSSGAGAQISDSATIPLSAQTPPVLAAGLIGQVTFQVNSRKGIAVPEPAIVYRGKDTFVRVLRDGKAYKVAVSLGHRIRDRFEILKGLEEGAIVIERSSRFVGDGDLVRVQGGEESGK